MYRNLSVAEARGNFAQTLRQAEAGESLLILRRNKPIAAVISPSEAVRFFHWRADEIGALFEENQAQQGNGTEDVPASSLEDATQQAAEGVTAETPSPSTVATNQPERAPAEPTIDGGFRAEIEKFICNCHAAGTPAETVLSEVLRICGQFGVTEEIAERLIARIYTGEG